MKKCCKRCGGTIFIQKILQGLYIRDLSDDTGRYGDYIKLGKYYCDKCGANDWELEKLITDQKE